MPDEYQAPRVNHLYNRPKDEEAEVDPIDNEEFMPHRRGVGDDVADPGRVEPWGDRDVDRNDFHLDDHIWVCGSCGYQTGSLEDPDGVCPNCTTQGEFVIQHQ